MRNKEIITDMSIDPNHRNMLERINSVFGSITNDVPYQFTKFYQIKADEMRQSLWSEYETARDFYIKTAEYFCNKPVPLTPPLQSPFLYIYLYKQKSKQVLKTVYPFLYGKACFTKNLTEKTFPAFLENACNTPYVKGEAAQSLFSALNKLLLEYPYNRVESIINAIKHVSPTSAVIALLSSLYLYISFDGNLYFDNNVVHQPAGVDELRYQNILNLRLERRDPYSSNAPAIPKALIRSYFSTVLANYNRGNPSGNYASALNEFLPDQLTHIFTSSAHHDPVVVQYSIENDNYIQKAVPEDIPFVGIKHIPIAKKTTSELVPTGASAFLETMCSTNLQLVEQFAVFLSQALSPEAGGLTVLLTRNHSELLSYMIRSVFPFVSIYAKDLSFNRITKAPYKKFLFLAQSNGASIVLIKDTLPSESNLPKIKQIMRGTAIDIKSDSFPTQKYKNKLHFVCITEDSRKAVKLEKTLKATLIDFSGYESTAESPLQLSIDDIHWLRTSFLLHGLKLRTCRFAGEKSAIQHKSKDSVEESVKAFLTDYCKFEPGAFCDTHEVYNSYAHFIAITQNLSAPLLTKISFNRLLRDFMEKEKDFKKVTYKQHWIYPKDQKKRQVWGYVGLRLPHNLPPISAESLISQDKELFKDYLMSMNRYKLHFDRIFEAKIVVSKK